MVAAMPAAQLMQSFAMEVGGFYLYPARTRDCGEESMCTIVGLNGRTRPPECRTASYRDEPGDCLYSGPAAEWKTKAVEATGTVFWATVR